MNHCFAALISMLSCVILWSNDSETTRSNAHWSYVAPVRPSIPISTGDRSTANVIDAFVVAERRKHGLAGVPPAEKHVLLRRLYLDLIGLPPTPEQMAAFLNDQSPDAYEAVVEMLLDSPQYGERWGRHWMDIWRYSDWAGYGMEVRQSQRHIWRWRDWIVDSLNQDKPYDQMIIEMLAGDEVAPNDPDTLRATGFVARSWFKFNRNVWLDGIVEHTSKAFLGITLNCARCHDHKYDPIPQQDYYRFRAFFEPHSVRTDQIPGQPDVMQDGLPRVFDSDMNSPTYMFMRGDEAQPVKETPLEPDVPSMLRTGKITIEPVQLPTTAYYPGLKSFIQEESRATAESAVVKARELLDQANRVVGEAKLQWARLTEADEQSGTPAGTARPSVADSAQAVDGAKNAARLAQAGLATAEAKRAFVRARIEADLARFTATPDPSAAELAIAAAQLERVANARETEENVWRSEQAYADAVAAAKPNDAKGKEAVAAAEKKLSEAREKAKTVNAALANTDAKYSPLTEVYPATSSGRRLALARWIASRDNPLTARVAINHIWMRHFGRPLVPSVFDFGMNGKQPSHPELLDWLAVEFMDQRWSMKWLHRLIVTSDTYRLASAEPAQQVAPGPIAEADRQSTNRFAANATIDPDNLYYWRQNPRRMEAEIVRDSTLCVAGQLDATMGGPDLDPAAGMSSHRRSVYFRTAYEKQMTFLALFDQAGVNECYRRGESVVPQQALALANSQLTLEQSRVLAGKLLQRLAAASNESIDERFIAASFETVLGRPAEESELTESLSFIRRQAQLFLEPAKLTAVATGSPTTLKPAADPAQRARENLVHVLLNHNDFVTIR